MGQRMKTVEDLRRCVAAYGSGGSLAAALQVNPVTMRRWLAGSFPPPEWIWKELPAILASRAHDLRQERDRLDRRAEECEALADSLQSVWALANPDPPNR
jgi:hypothetical protein